MPPSDYVVTVFDQDREAKTHEIERLRAEIEKKKRVLAAKETGVYAVETEDLGELTNSELLSLSQNIAEKRKSLEESLQTAKQTVTALSTELSDLRSEHSSLVKSIKSTESKTDSLRTEANLQAAKLMHLSERIQTQRDVQQTARNHIETQDIVSFESWSPRYRSSSNTSMSSRSSAARAQKTTYFPSILRSYKGASGVW